MEEMSREALEFDRRARKKEMERNRIGMCVRVLLAAAVIAAATVFSSKIPGFGKYWFIVPFFGLFAACWVLKYAWRDYREAYKLSCVRGALETMFTDLYYAPFDGISDRTISESGLIYMGDSCHVEDCIRARYNGLYLERSDVRIQEQRQQTQYNRYNGGEYRGKRQKNVNVTLFRGRWLIYDFKKPFRADVQIVQKGFRCTGQQIGQNKHMDTTFKRRGLGLDTGNKHFLMYIKNSNEAFHVSKNLMDRIQKLADSVTGKLMVGFVGTELHIAIDDNRPSLEPPYNIFLPLREDRVTKKLRSEMDSITEFIEKLRLENNLFLQED